MKNRGSTPTFTTLVGVYPRNIHTKFEANPRSGSREEVEKQIKVPSGTVVVTHLFVKKIVIKKT